MIEILRDAYQKYCITEWLETRYQCNKRVGDRVNFCRPSSNRTCASNAYGFPFRFHCYSKMVKRQLKLLRIRISEESLPVFVAWASIS